MARQYYIIFKGTGKNKEDLKFIALVSPNVNSYARALDVLRKGEYGMVRGMSKYRTHSTGKKPPKMKGKYFVLKKNGKGWNVFNLR